MPPAATGSWRPAPDKPLRFWGETRSYGEVAESVGSPRAARAIGQAVGANPFPILIPCHRVLAARRRLGGFGGGHDALDWKRYLLSLEASDWVE